MENPGNSISKPVDFKIRRSRAPQLYYPCYGTDLDSVCHGLLQTVLIFENSDFRPYIVSYLKSAEKIKRLAVENTYTDHENNIQRVFESTGAKFNCVTVSQPAHVCPASDTGYSLQIYNLYGSLMIRMGSMHYPDLNSEENRPTRSNQK